MVNHEPPAKDTETRAWLAVGAADAQQRLWRPAIRSSIRSALLRAAALADYA